eukprot:1249221-Rhodomonas_salina.4
MALTFRSLPPIFIPSTCLLLLVSTPSCRWWRCTGYHRATTCKIDPVHWVFEGEWISPSACKLSATLTAALLFTFNKVGTPHEGPLANSLKKVERRGGW